MKYIFSVAFVFIQLLISEIYAQKPVIDSSIYNEWPKAQDASISNDGKYITYTIDKLPLRGMTAILMSTQNKWRMEKTGGGFRITADSRKAIYGNSSDSLTIITLGTDSTEIIPHFCRGNFISNDRDTWLIYYLTDSSKEMFVRNLRTGWAISISQVANYFSSDGGNILIIRRDSKKEGKVIQSLEWVDIRNGNLTTIWQGTGIVKGCIFNKKYMQVAFPIEDTKNNQIQRSIWYYKDGISKAVNLIGSELPGFDSGSQIEYLDHFSEDGDRLFFSYKKPSEKINKADPNAMQVDVWSYTDTRLQSDQLHEIKDPSYEGPNMAVIRIKDRQVFPLNIPGELNRYINDRFVLLYHRDGDARLSESHWNRASRFSVFLVSTEDGSRKLIKEHTLLQYQLSPEGKYLIWYESKQKNYLSMEISTGVVKNITKAISTDWTEYENDHPDAAEDVGAISGWLKGDTAVLLHDQNDIWLVDLSGRILPLCLTNRYGRRNHIAFRLANDERHAILSPGQSILLSAFNRATKDNGFYSKSLFEKGDPTLLTMGPYVYEVADHNPKRGIGGQAPVKARDEEAYIVWRMSATESPNFFYTRNFVNFSPISEEHPEKKCNWLTSELISWKTLDGGISQGVLYKPENFDPKKKYPVIFYYYERMSDELNQFRYPEVSSDRLDIPTYVSNGYLILAPDVHYKIGETGQSAVNSIVSAARWLSKQPWVDSTKMGLQGHSFGGYETNYVITHSHLFAAACSASGLSDYISSYGSLIDGYSEEGLFEMSQNRIGATLWQRPDLYIKNSPIFRANQVTTPLLMMHTTNDGIYHFSDAVEFFTGLRRLGKKVWMLQYDNEDHSLLGEAAAIDYTIRMRQFFDHYLKGAPAPKWMVEGIPASEKGIDDGLQLEPPGVEPGPGLLTPEEQKKVDSLMHRKPITVTIK